MKSAWVGLSAVMAAVALTLWSSQRRGARPEDRLLLPARAASQSAAAPVSSEWGESVSNRLKLQHYPGGVSESNARGEIDERLIEWRALLTSSNAAEFVQSLSWAELDTPFGAAALEVWLAQDGANASAWIAGQPEATDHHAWIVAEALVRQPHLFAAFCAGLNHSSWSQSFLDHSGRALVKENPSAAVALAERLVPGERRARLFETIASDWVLRDPGVAQAWINGVSDPSLRSRLIAVGAQSYASTNPLAALEWLIAQSPFDSALQEPLQTIAGIWRYTAGPEMIESLDYLEDVFLPFPRGS